MLKNARNVLPALVIVPLIGLVILVLVLFVSDNDSLFAAIRELFPVNEAGVVSDADPEPDRIEPADKEPWQISESQMLKLGQKRAEDFLKLEAALSGSPAKVNLEELIKDRKEASAWDWAVKARLVYLELEQLKVSEKEVNAELEELKEDLAEAQSPAQEERGDVIKALEPVNEAAERASAEVPGSLDVPGDEGERQASTEDEQSARPDPSREEVPEGEPGLDSEPALEPLAVNKILSPDASPLQQDSGSGEPEESLLAVVAPEDLTEAPGEGGHSAEASQEVEKLNDKIKELEGEKKGLGEARKKNECRMEDLEDVLYNAKYGKEAHGFLEKWDGDLYRKYVESCIERKDLDLNTFGDPQDGNDNARAKNYLEFASRAKEMANEEEGGLLDQFKLINWVCEQGRGASLQANPQSVPVPDTLEKQRLLFEALMAFGKLEAPDEDTQRTLVEFMEKCPRVLDEYGAVELKPAALSARKGLWGEGPLDFVKAANFIHFAGLRNDEEALSRREKLLVQGLVSNSSGDGGVAFWSPGQSGDAYVSWVLKKTKKHEFKDIELEDQQNWEQEERRYKPAELNIKLRFGNVLKDAWNGVSFKPDDWKVVVPEEWLAARPEDCWDDKQLNEWWRQGERIKFLRDAHGEESPRNAARIRGLLARYVYERGTGHEREPDAKEPERWLAVAVMSFCKGDDYLAACKIWDELYKADRRESVRIAIRLSGYKELRDTKK